MLRVGLSFIEIDYVEKREYSINVGRIGYLIFDKFAC